MGNESSSENHRHLEQRVKQNSSGVTRSSSLRVTRTQPNSSYTNKRDIKVEKGDHLIFSTKFDKKPKLVRSSTFDSSSTFTRPTIRHANYKLHEDRPTIRHANHKLHEDIDLNERYEISRKINDIIEDPINYNHRKSDRISDSSAQQHREEELFVPKKNLTKTPIPSPVDFIESNTNLSTESQVTNTLQENNNSEDSFVHSIKVQKDTIRVRSNSLDTNTQKNRKLKSDLEGQHSYESGTMILHQDKKSLSQTLFNSVSSNQTDDQVKTTTTTQQKKKIINRSQSMGTCKDTYQTTYGGKSTNDTIHEESMVNNNDEVDAVERTTQKRSLERRISDSCLLKEQHIKRSQQFTEMLKQIQSQRSNPTNKKLSSYGLGAITEKNEPVQETQQKTRSERRNEYLNSFLKEQSERINTLSEAIKGDPEQIRHLRASFRERSLKAHEKVVLPTRPSSAQLPRKKTVFHFSSISSSESETDDVSLTQWRTSDTSQLDQNRNIISKVSATKKKNTVQKQSNETPTQTDDSLKKYKQPRKDAIRFSTSPTSLSYANGANNVAVVKPMVFLRQPKEKSSDKIMIVNSVISAHYDDSPGKGFYKDPVDMYNNKERILEEEKYSIQESIQTESAQTKLWSNESLSNVEVILEPEQETIILHKQKSEEINCLCEEASMVEEIDSNKEDPNEKDYNSTNLEQNVQNESEVASVHHITESLSKVMGDLKQLREQDIKLARQLIGLGKSIKDFKHERKSQFLENVVEEEESES